MVPIELLCDDVKSSVEIFLGKFKPAPRKLFIRVFPFVSFSAGYSFLLFRS